MSEISTYLNTQAILVGMYTLTTHTYTYTHTCTSMNIDLQIFSNYNG